MKRTQVEHFLSAKLQFEKAEKKRHTHFNLRVQGKYIITPAIICLSRSSGEVANNNLRGIASGLGLREPELRSSINCHNGRQCLLLCFSAYLLTHFRHLLEYGDRVVYDASAQKAMLTSLDMLMDELQGPAGPGTWRASEAQILGRVRPQLEGLVKHPVLGGHVRRLLDRF
jgi:hypothetical protein